MSPKRWKRFLGVAVLLSFFVASGAHAKVELVLWTYHNNNAMADRLIWEAQEYSRLNPDITITVRQIPFADLKRELTRSVATGNPPDIAIIDNPDHASFAAMGALVDLTQYVSKWGEADKYFPGPWASTIWEGRNYGVPQNSNTVALYYNVDRFKDAGLDSSQPPETWEDLVAYAQKLTDSTRGYYGLSFAAIRSEEGTFQWLPFLQQNGGSIEALDSPEAIEALQLWADLVRSGAVSREVLNFTQADAMQQFAAGSAAMSINGSWQVPELRGSMNPEFEWSVALLPYSKQRASALGGENWAVMSRNHVQEAWDFIAWTQERSRVEQHYIAGGRLPSRADVAEESDYWDSDPAYRVFVEQLKYATARGPHPRWPEISNAIQLAIQSALSGQASPEAALRQAAQTVARILR